MRGSSSIVDDAFDGSTAARPDSASATYDPGSRKRRARPCTAGASRRSQAILAATWPPSRFVPVRSYSRSGAIRSATSPHASSPRRSIQMIASCTGAPSPSTATSPSSCEPKDTAATRSASTPPVAVADGAADGGEPGGGVLLGPARPRVADVVALVGGREQLAVGRPHELGARPLGADVDADDEIAVLHWAPSECVRSSGGVAAVASLLGGAHGAPLVPRSA